MRAGDFVHVSVIVENETRMIFQGVVIKDFCDGTISVFVAAWGHRPVIVEADDLEVVEPDELITLQDLELEY